jgi:hypothetical protein
MPAPDQHKVTGEGGGHLHERACVLRCRQI